MNGKFSFALLSAAVLAFACAPRSHNNDTANNTSTSRSMRSHNSHEAVEFAKDKGVADETVEILYRAYWERGEVINDAAVLAKLLGGILDSSEMLSAVHDRRYADRIIPFYEEAYASGVYYVPTFFIGGEELAEQPIATRTLNGDVLRTHRT